jgi:macrolide-specific efflux system membrane fusion protein
MTLRRLSTLLIVLAVLTGGGYALRSQQTTPPAAVNLPSATAVIGDVEEAVLASGALEPVRQVSVGAQANGRLNSLKVTLGQTVAQGDLIAEIDSVTQQNALRSAEAELAVLHAQREERLANLAYADSVLARQKQMFGQNAVSRDVYESAEMTVRTTRAQIAALDAQIISGGVKVETARANLGYTRVTAPAAGTVLAIVTQQGQTVNAVQSAPTIVVLGDVSTMTVKAKISEADVLRVKTGQEVFFSVLGAPERRFPGRIAFVEPAPDTLKTQNASSASVSSSASSSSTSTAIYYNALFEVPNPDGRLLTSMTVQVTVVVGQARGVVTVPSTALRRRADGAWLDVIGEDGKPVPRKVTVGLDNRIVAEISAGLTAGERVVATRIPGAAGGPNAARRMRGPLGF